MSSLNEQEFDIIFAGGGTAACVAAGRLALSDPNLSILLVEGGKNNLNDPIVRHPALFPLHLTPYAQTNILYKSKPSTSVNGREIIIPSGGILGGGSSTNFMIYTRAQATDYDNWKTEGWDFKSLLPLLKKLETFHSSSGDLNDSVHGFSGPVHISQGNYNCAETTKDVLAAALSIGKPEITDLQDFYSCDGFSKWPRYVSPEGRRQDAAHCYIHPLLASGKHPNLHLLTESKVTRAIFDENKRAIGLEYEPNASFQPMINLSKRVPTIVRARKFVVVSAGALGTPSILERSGIGKGELLKELDISIVSDLPSVGENYQDHHCMIYPYKTELKEDQTIDCVLDGRIDISQAQKEDQKILGWNSIDLAAKLRPTDEEVAALGPEFQELWDKNMKEDKSKPFVFTGILNAFVGDHSNLDPVQDGTQFMSAGTWDAYPYSRGNIHITSKDAQVPARFQSGFLEHPMDIKGLTWAYKKQREVFRRTNTYRGELALGHPKFKPGSKAALHVGPTVVGGFKTLDERRALPPIEYSENDDQAIEEWIKSNVSTTWHSCGTCKMAPLEEGGVVDGKLNVYGVTGLKVADLSMMPKNIGANTNNTALLVGEKAAQIICEELDIKI